MGKLNLENGLHFDNPNENPTSAGHVCDLEKTLDFSEQESVIAAFMRFSSDISKVTAIIPKILCNGLHDFLGQRGEKH